MSLVDPSYSNMWATMLLTRSRVLKTVRNIEPLTTPNNYNTTMVNLDSSMQKCDTLYAGTQKWIYTCMITEICCPTGCCSNPLRNLTHFWYFWFVLTFIAVMVAGCLYYYKTQQIREFRQRHQARLTACRRTQNRQQRLLAHRLLLNSQAHESEPYRGDFDYFLDHYTRQDRLNLMQPRPHINAGINEHILNQIFGNYQRTPRTSQAENSQSLQMHPLFRLDTNSVNEALPTVGNSLNPPPSYDTLSFQKAQIKEEDPPPLYTDACKLMESPTTENTLVVDATHGTETEEVMNILNPNNNQDSSTDRNLQ